KCLVQNRELLLVALRSSDIAGARSAKPAREVSERIGEGISARMGLEFLRLGPVAALDGVPGGHRGVGVGHGGSSRVSTCHLDRRRNRAERIGIAPKPKIPVDSGNARVVRLVGLATRDGHIERATVGGNRL